MTTLATQLAANSNVQTSQTAVSTVSAEDNTSKISSDFETFLLMLTTQLENQDPLNPVESQDFAVQLATFSGVEQQVLTNDLLESLNGAIGASDLAQLAGWVGMEARVQTAVSFDGTPIDIAIEPAPGADRTELIVRDALGREVSREEVPASNGTFAWVGQDSEGQPLPLGSYTLELGSSSSGNLIGVQTVAHYAQVTEARQGAAGTELVLAGGQVVPSQDVSALREPASQ
ncbi:MAG: flagellar hook capping FlgD N-terminal domain-containing protein [Pseudomonadota bacterium]